MASIHDVAFGSITGHLRPVLVAVGGLMLVAGASVAQAQDPDPSAANVSMTYVELDVWGDDPSEVGFAAPNGLALDADGNVYSTEFQGGHLRKFTPDGELLFEVAGSGDAEGELSNPIGVAIATDGTIYVSESGSSRVSRFASDGSFLSTFGAAGSEPGDFLSAMGIAVSDDGEVYVADFGNHRVQVFDGEGTFLRSWGQRGSEPGSFENPIGLQIGPGGAVWVVDSGNERVQTFDPTGALRGVFDEVGQGPQIISLTDDGDFYLSSPRAESTVTRYGPDGERLERVADGLSGPHGTVTGLDGRLYVADTANGVIRLFRPTPP
jgi:tripartite motif-containing protein 71